MAELKPCPFCGCTNITILSKKTNIWRNGFGDCVEYRVYSARCNRCNARGATAGGQCAPAEKTVKIYGTETLVHSYEYYREKAAEAWNSRTEKRWIPVEDALPKNRVTVIFTINRGKPRIGCGYRIHSERGGLLLTRWFDKLSGLNFSDYDVTAWMPMPEAYKEDNDDDT